MNRYRLQVDRFHPSPRTSVVFTDPQNIDPAAQQSLTLVVDAALNRLRNLGIPNPALALTAVAIEVLADQEAYRRVCEQKGLLAL